jgi:hypothetical protein
MGFHLIEEIPSADHQIWTVTAEIFRTISDLLPKSRSDTAKQVI